MASATGVAGSSSRLATHWARLNGPQRVAGVDLARGLAVIGMLAAHLMRLADFDFGDASTWDAVASGRSSILFATLAGVSIGLVTGGRAPLPPPQRRAAQQRLAVRAGGLWVIGILLIAAGMPVFVILPAYAILFLLALPFVSLTAPALFIIAAALALVMPFAQALMNALPLWSSPRGELLALATGWHYPFPVWIAFVLAGLGVARAGIRRIRVQLGMLGFGSLLAVTGYGLDAAVTPVPLLSTVWTADPHSSGLLEVIGSGGFALAALGLCLLACRTIVRWIALPLRAVGAMPLTAYTAQLVSLAIAAGILLGDSGDLGGFRDLDPFWPMTIGLVLACTAWALLVGRGPLEWLLDRAAKLVAPGSGQDGASGHPPPASVG